MQLGKGGAREGKEGPAVNASGPSSRVEPFY